MGKNLVATKTSFKELNAQCYFAKPYCSSERGLELAHQRPFKGILSKEKQFHDFDTRKSKRGAKYFKHAP